MDAITKLQRLAEHRERIARLELANAERDRQAQEYVVHQHGEDIRSALGFQGEDPFDHLHRHGYALRMEMSRRGAERRLMERQRDVNLRQELVNTAARETGTLERLIELREAERSAELARVEQRRLDESGLMAWWRVQP